MIHQTPHVPVHKTLMYEVGTEDFIFDTKSNVIVLTDENKSYRCCHMTTKWIDWLKTTFERQRLSIFPCFQSLFLKVRLTHRKLLKLLVLCLMRMFQDSHQQCLPNFPIITSAPLESRSRKHLNLDQAKCLASALVSTRLDYCNSLLHDVAVRDILKAPESPEQSCHGGPQSGSLCT